MAIIARTTNTGESFVPAPAGLHRAICCDVVDLGMVPGKWGEKHKVRIIWQTEALMPDGKPYLVDQRYTLSLDERSILRRDLESWGGKPLTLSQAAGFDLERLVGVTCALLVVQKPGRDGNRVFANVQTVLPKMPGAALQVRDYVRVANRQQNNPVASGVDFTKRLAAAAPPTPIGPSFAPPPTGWPAVLPEPKPAAPPFDDGPFTESAAHTVTADDIPF